RKWQTELSPWSDFIESARRAYGETPKLAVMAATAAGIRSKTVRAKTFDRPFESTLPLAERARHARLQAFPEWWRKALSDAREGWELQWVLLLLLAWGSKAVLLSLVKEIEAKLD